MTFGAFVRATRLEKGFTLRQLAHKLDISPIHMSNIETGQRAAPKEDILQKMIQIFLLSKQEKEMFFELAAKSKNYTAIPADLPEYLVSSEYARIALRVAKDVGANDEDWKKFIKALRERGKEGEQR